MFTINAKFIRAEIFRRSLSLKEFAAQCGLSEITARKLTRDGATATSKTIAQLAKFFSVDGNDLILWDAEQ